jgi:hypothetical protein
MNCIAVNSVICPYRVELNVEIEIYSKPIKPEFLCQTCNYTEIRKYTPWHLWS